MRTLTVLLVVIFGLSLGWAAVELAEHFKPQIVTGSAPQAPEERWRAQQ